VFDSKWANMPDSKNKNACFTGFFSFLLFEKNPVVTSLGEWAMLGSSWRAAVAGIAASEKVEFFPIKAQPLGGDNPEAR